VEVPQKVIQCPRGLQPSGFSLPAIGPARDTLRGCPLESQAVTICAMPSVPLLKTDLPDLPLKRGKVRDVYDLGEQLLLVSSDRISAFDWVLPTGIPDKGRVLTQVSNFWFEKLEVPHHLLATEVSEMGLPSGIDLKPLAGRSVLVRKTEVVPIECVVRGYLAGSGWKEYRRYGLRRSIAPGFAGERPATGADFHAGHQSGGWRSR